MSFGEWHAYAERTWHKPGVALHIGREIAPGQQQVVHGDLLVSTVDVPEGQMVSGSDYPVVLDEETAKAVYQALHRLYGHENPDGRIAALEEALQVERGRVNAFLQTMLQPRATVSQPRPEHRVG